MKGAYPNLPEVFTFSSEHINMLLIKTSFAYTSQNY